MAMSQSALVRLSTFGTASLHVRHQRNAFRPARTHVVSRSSKNKLHSASADSVDDVVLRTLLPHTKDRPDGRSTGDSVLRERVEALRQRLDKGSGDATSTSNPADDSGLLARVTHQLQRLNPSRLSPRVRGLILLNILVLLCGANWVVLKETENVFDPFTFAALRFSLAALVFSPWVGNAVKDRTILRGGLELGLWSALAYMTQSVGLETSDASRASFISTFTVRPSVTSSSAHCMDSRPSCSTQLMFEHNVCPPWADQPISASMMWNTICTRY